MIILKEEKIMTRTKATDANQTPEKKTRKLVTVRHKNGIITFYSDAYNISISHSSLNNKYGITINKDARIPVQTYRAASIMLDTICNTISNSSKYDEDTIDITLPNIIVLPLTRHIGVAGVETDEDFEKWYKYYTKACVNTILGYILGDTTAVCDMAYYMEPHHSSYDLVLYLSDCVTLITNTCFIFKLTDEDNYNIPIPGDILTMLSDKFNLEYDIFCTAGLIRLGSEIYEKYNRHSKEYFKERVMDYRPGMTLISVEDRIAYDVV